MSFQKHQIKYKLKEKIVRETKKKKKIKDKRRDTIFTRFWKDALTMINPC